MLNSDNRRYLRFTGPMVLDKAVHTLDGLLRGIAIDGRVNRAEVAAVSGWLDEYQVYVNRHPFTEIVEKVREIIEDGAIDEEEKADLLWLCGRYQSPNTFYDDITSDMQRLHAICGGIAADGQINAAELDGLQEWLESHTHLKTMWPYDEFESLLLAVLRDRRIDPDEHCQLLEFFKDFVDLPGCGRAIGLRDDVRESPLIKGVCSACPEIQFRQRRFCFTGRSERLTRTALAKQVADLGGEFSPNVTKLVHYLIVGADGNPCWAFSCYGRKVELAMTYRRSGAPIVIVHEHDYWDAVLDEGWR